MANKNLEVDQYIAKAQPFAKPILKHLRTIIHKACPQVTEEIKWGAPFYLYQNRVLCATMAFKGHCALVFWKSVLISRKKGERAKAELERLRRISFLEETRNCFLILNSQCILTNPQPNSRRAKSDPPP